MAFFKCSFSWGHASQWTGFLFLVLGTQKFSFLSWFTKFRKKIFIYNTWVFRKQTVSTNVPMDTAFPGCFDHLRVFFQPRSVLEKKRGNVQLGTSIYDLSWIFGQLMLNAEESFFLFSFIFPRLIWLWQSVFLSQRFFCVDRTCSCSRSVTNVVAFIVCVIKVPHCFCWDQNK